MTGDAKSFIRAHTAVIHPPLVPEIALYLATEITPIWQASEEWLERNGVPPPFWAFCWPGGQALSRHVLDRPDIVAGRRVLDFASGCGIAAIAAMRAGAGSAIANDIDENAATAAAMNAALNDVTIETVESDLVTAASPADWDVILAGDICYERPMAEAVMPWLQAQARQGALVLMGDPGRNYLPSQGLEEVARYDVPTSLELEDREMRETVVWRVLSA